ncbi:MAG: DUF1934 domain-containing protein [Clostridiales bacterium]|jgi:uncharacterized beta-barrel protein YwiB (DUF1934 family)|nr:DUF1934 domain-containing protein [Clostridiales bacterium]
MHTPGKDAIVSVTGLQASGGAAPDFIEIVTEGKYQLRGDSFYVTYEETVATGMEGTTTTIKATGDVITMIRFGAVNSHFIFQRGRRHISHYDTGFGAFTIALTANSVDVDVGEHGGSIHLGYEVDIGESGTIYNELMVEIRPGAAERSRGGRPERPRANPPGSRSGRGRPRAPGRRGRR